MATWEQKAELKREIDSAIKKLDSKRGKLTAGALLTSIDFIVNDIREDDVQLHYCVFCKHSLNRIMLLATSSRLIMPELLTSDLSFTDITSVTYETKWLSRYSGVLTIEASGKTLRFEKLDNSEGKDLSDFLSQRLGGKFLSNTGRAAKEWENIYKDTLASTFYKLRNQIYDIEEVTDSVLRGTTRRIMEKYRLSEEEMLDIVSKFSARWTKGT